MTNICIIVCDLCGSDIDTKKSYVDASVYGAHFCLGCVTPEQIIILQALDLDDIGIMTPNVSYEKLIYSDHARCMLGRGSYA